MSWTEPHPWGASLTPQSLSLSPCSCHPRECSWTWHLHDRVVCGQMEIGEFLSERTTVQSEMPKRTTSRMKCQNYRGGRFPRRHVSPAATVKGGTFLHGFSHRARTENGVRGPCRLGRWRHHDVAPAATSWGGKSAWQHSRHSVLPALIPWYTVRWWRWFWGHHAKSNCFIFFGRNLRALLPWCLLSSLFIPDSLLFL